MGFVIKYGGNAMTDDTTRAAVAARIRTLRPGGVPPVVVHGGGPFIQAALDEAALEHRFVRGLRVTSEAGVAVVERVVTLLGKRLAFEIGGAVALTGRDARLLTAEAFDPKLGRVGRMTAVNAAVLHALRVADMVPVVGCIAIDDDGGPLNVNADEVAGAVAGALGEGVVFLTNVPGVLDDPSREDSLLPRLTAVEAQERIADGRIAGGMIPKVGSALTALALGAPYAVVADGRDVPGVERALAGGGTRVVQS